MNKTIDVSSKFDKIIIFVNMTAIALAAKPSVDFLMRPASHYDIPNARVISYTLIVLLALAFVLCLLCLFNKARFKFPMVVGVFVTTIWLLVEYIFLVDFFFQEYRVPLRHISAFAVWALTLGPRVIFWSTLNYLVFLKPSQAARFHERQPDTV